eukprot:14346819-Ditylum_brightwellii.AAC.1
MGSKGTFFDITAKELDYDDTTIFIDSLDIHTNKEKPCLVAVYVLKEKASHIGHKTNPYAWSLITNTTIQCSSLFK